MPQTPGDEKKEPSLELPTLKLPGLGRRHKVAPQEAPPEDITREDITREDITREDVTREETPAREEPTSPLPREPAPEPAAVAAPPRRRAQARQASARKTLRRMSLPALPGPAAAALTGGATGLAGSVATYAALAGCEAVRGVRTCGGAPGFFVLLAIVVLMVLLGSVLLKALGVGESTSTSFLAVGLVAVTVMLTLLDVITSPWMFLVIPALGAVAYLLAHWVTTRFDDEATGRRDWT